MIERTTVRLPPELLARAKRKAAAEGRTLTALLEQGLRLVVDDSPKPAKPERVMPRVSTAKGGLHPGIDLKDIQEMEDREYIERLMRMR